MSTVTNVLKGIGITDHVEITVTPLLQSLVNIILSIGKYGLIIGISAGLGGLAVAGINVKEKIVPKVIEAIGGVETTAEQKITSADPGAVKDLTEGAVKIESGIGGILGVGGVRDPSKTKFDSDPRFNNGGAQPIKAEGKLIPTAIPMDSSAIPTANATPAIYNVGGSSKKTKSKRSKYTKSNRNGNSKKCQSKKCLFTKGDQVYLSF
jgi:hypothetical protein